jgi:hypothetical protein
MRFRIRKDLEEERVGIIASRRRFALDLPLSVRWQKVGSH